MPYEPAIRVPLLVRTPKGFLDGDEIREVDLPVANIDLAPTMLEFADGKPCGQRDQCRRLDGRSFVPLLEGRDEERPSDRTMVIEASDEKPCPFTGVRTEAYVYVEWKTAEKDYCMPDRSSSGWIRRELYDFADDPAQLDNLLVTDPEAVAQEANMLEGQLDELRNCAGIEGRDPEPLSGSYCE